MSHRKTTQIRYGLLLFGTLLVTSYVLAQTSAQSDATKLAVASTNLSSEEAARLEERVKTNPEDLAARSRLLDYYMLKRFESPSARKARQAHILWLIEHRPDAPVSGLPYAFLDPTDGETYYKAKKLWLQQTEAHKTNPAVLANAANFFLIYDRATAEDLLKKGRALEPDNPQWSERLGQLYGLDMKSKLGEGRGQAATKSLKELEAAFSRSSETEDRMYKLPDLAKVAFEAGQWDKAQAYATELLNKAIEKRDSWNYGNAVHHGNLILGRLALREDNMEKAKHHLLEAGRTPGSPQLNSFGPNMALAKELLEKGERDVVLQYFQLCGKFWQSGKEQLADWTALVNGGRTPDFGANLDY